uniref:Uncharacterized protein n=1 Tax=Romanomermis culicivorax TaxID=13658 RepID=A0A915IB20_ROMCU
MHTLHRGVRILHFFRNNLQRLMQMRHFALEKPRKRKSSLYTISQMGQYLTFYAAESSKKKIFTLHYSA